jgi:hypothetical protein
MRRLPRLRTGIESTGAGVFERQLSRQSIIGRDWPLRAGTYPMIRSEPVIRRGYPARAAVAPV